MPKEKPEARKAISENTTSLPAELAADASEVDVPQYGQQDEIPLNGPVRKLQRFLRDTGFYKGRIDGDYRDKTLTALNNYRASVGLAPTPRPDGTFPDGGPLPEVEREAPPTVEDYKKPTGADPTKHGPQLQPIGAEERKALFGSYDFRPYPAQHKRGQEITILRDRVTGRPWEDTNIITLEIPQLVGVPLFSLGGQPFSGRAKVHRLLEGQVLGAFEAIEREGLKHLLLTVDGFFYPRYTRGSDRSLSNHAYGTALDLNAEWNGMYQTPAKVGEKGSVRQLVPIFEHFGFYWGGYGWGRERFDGMHFEAAKVAGL